MSYDITRLPEALALLVHPNVAHTAQDWADMMMPDLLTNGIGRTAKRLSAFLGQLAVESAGFSCVEENLNYSADRLCQVWPTRFEPDTAGQYSYKPESIANRAYCLRMGNGGLDTGDGWRYRGAGFIQLTGKDNQLACAKALLIDPAKIGDYLRTPLGALRSAYWFWNSRSSVSLNTLADGWFITSITRHINGGTEGLAQRIQFSNQVLGVLGQ